MDVRLEAVHARYPAAFPDATALRGVNLAVRAGERLAVIGPSGAGKTTLLQIAAAALRPSGGEVTLAGIDPWTRGTRALQRQRGRVFMAPQTPPLPPRQRVVTAVLAGRLPSWGLAKSLRSLLHPLDIGDVHAALDRFGLADKLFARVDRLSGGERQRVGLARALLAPASLWLIDEPLAALDPTRAEQAIAALTTVARERGITLLASMHQVDVALARFDRIVGLRDGTIVFDRPASQVSRDELGRLYAQHESELDSRTGHRADEPPGAPPPIAMHCR